MKENSIYYDPLTLEKVKMLDNIDDFDNALCNKLTSSVTDNNSKETVNKSQGIKDKAFIMAYLICLGVFIVTGIGSLEWSIPTKIYDKFVNTLLPELKAIMVVSLVIGIVWSWAFSYFTKIIVYSMLLAVPTLLLVASMMVLANSGAVLVSLAFALSSFMLFGLFKINKYGIDSTIDIVKSAAGVLRDNVQIYVYAMLTTMVYILLVLGWFILFAGIFTTSSSILQINAIMLLIWSGSIIGNFQRGMIANCVYNWYFKKKTSNKYRPLNYVGQYAFAGLVLSIFDFVRFANWSAKKTIEQFKHGVIKSISGYLLNLLSLFETTLSHYTNFSVLQVVISQGKLSFLDASTQVFILFRRNLLLGAINDMTSTFIFTTTSGCTALGSGVIWHTINTNADQDLMMPTIVAIVTFMVLRFFTGIYSAAIDAAFLCYSMDVDGGKLHQGQFDPERLTLYQAFGIRLSNLPK